MNQKKTGSSRNKSFTVVLIVAVAIASIAFGYWIGMFSPRRVEKIYFGPCYWEDDECILHIANTGADELIINKVWINDTLLDSTEWESFPSMRFQPGDQGELHVTPSLVVFEDGIAYQFTVETVTGNSFSHTVVAESGFTWMGYEDIEITVCDWTWGAAGSRTVKITIENTGTKDVTINHIKINHWEIANTAVSPQPPFVFKTTDSAKDLTITYDYTNGSSYDIAVVTSSGHEFTDNFTGGQDET